MRYIRGNGICAPLYARQRTAQPGVGRGHFAGQLDRAPERINRFAMLTHVVQRHTQIAVSFGECRFKSRGLGESNRRLLKAALMHQ